MKKIGIIFGMESTFPPALVDKINSLNDPDVQAELAIIGEVRMAESQGADFAVLGPIFGEGTPGTGLSVLAKACGIVPPPEHTEAAPHPNRFPVLAMGGVTLENVSQCLAAGAAGIASTRLFQENDVAEVVRKLRALR